MVLTVQSRYLVLYLSIWLGYNVVPISYFHTIQWLDWLSGSGDTILHPFIHSQNIVSLTLNQGKPSNRVSNSCSPESSSSSGWLMIMMVLWGELRWVELVCFFFFFISLPGGALCRISFSSSFAVALQRILFVPYNNKQASPAAQDDVNDHDGMLGCCLLLVSLKWIQFTFHIKKYKKIRTVDPFIADDIPEREDRACSSSMPVSLKRPLIATHSNWLLLLGTKDDVRGCVVCFPLNTCRNYLELCQNTTNNINDRVHKTVTTDG